MKSTRRRAASQRGPRRMRVDLEPTREDVRIEVDGVSLAGTLYLPDGEPRAVLVVHPATATYARFYAAFAARAAARGLAAVTYDYRGTGRSGHPRQYRDVRMSDWITRDAPAVAAWAAAHVPNVPRLAVGHSVGGHALALGHGTDGLAAFATVGSYAGGLALIPDRAERWRVQVWMYVLAPLVGRLAGYVPARLGIGGDLPTGAVLEWGVWCRHPGYFFDGPWLDAATRVQRVALPVLAVGTTDDPWATPEMIDALTDRLLAADVERRTITPRQVGATRLGHHGLLRDGVGTHAWDEILSWLLKRTGGTHQDT